MEENFLEAAKDLLTVQQYNHPEHASRNTTEQFRSKHFYSLDQSSPDLNPKLASQFLLSWSICAQKGRHKASRYPKSITVVKLYFTATQNVEG